MTATVSFLEINISDSCTLHEGQLSLPKGNILSKKINENNSVKP